MEKELPCVATVSLVESCAATDRLYEYTVPVSLRETVREGCFVLVPFGGADRKQLALVQGLSDHSDYPLAKLKPVLQAVDEAVSLSAEGVALCNFMKSYTFCTVGEAIRTQLPSAALSRIEEMYRVVENGIITPLSPAKAQVVDAIRCEGEISLAALRSRFGGKVNAILRELVTAGVLAYRCRALAPTNKRYTEEIFLSQSPEETAAALSALRGKKQIAVLERLLASDLPYTVPALEAEVPDCRPALRALAEKGLLHLVKTEAYRDPYAHLYDRVVLPPLSAEQAQAVETISALCACGEPKAALLHGVTGSGKTRVIQGVIDGVLARGKQVIVLVPEISLTQQTVRAFASVYGDRIAVLHSSLSAGERFDAWRRIRAGEVDVCIGTRSAVFAPFPNLGLIVIDEEQEHTYKSDSDPKYHARDIARFRAAYHKATMLLASATPSLESYYKAKQGAYTLVKLTERFGTATLPTVQLVDLRAENQSGRMHPVSRPLLARLDAVQKAGEQSILFVNRRGYHNFMTCPQCGTAVTCPHCSVSLTYHRRGRDSHGYLTCHYCGYRTGVPNKCASCGSEHLQFIGFGTQQVEELLSSDLPEARVMRMDADSTSQKDAYDRLLTAFREGEADILLGTQMVTKGHDFPNVTLVGVLFAEQSLYLDDFRANERTFDLITQVVGRAGRSARAGTALVQTYNPEHPVLQLAVAQDYEAFYAQEIALRRALMFPPFCDIVTLTVSGTNEQALMQAVTELGQDLHAKQAGEFSDVPIILFGPFEASVYKINETYRMRFLLKCKNQSRLRQLLTAVLDGFHTRAGKGLSISIDINPSAL